MSSIEERIAARIAEKVTKKGQLWEGATWKDIVEYARADPDTLSPVERRKWVKVLEYLQAHREQVDREFPPVKKEYEDKPLPPAQYWGNHRTIPIDEW